MLRTFNSGQTSPSEQTRSSLWIDFVLPMSYVAGQIVTFTLTGGVLSETEFPTSYEVFGSGSIITVNGGVVGAGPYSGSGRSYAPGVVATTYRFSTGDSWVTSGLGQTAALNSGDVSTSDCTLVNGSGVGFSGEGMIPAAYGPIGWWPDLSSEASTPGSKTLSPGDHVTYFLQLNVLSYDAVNPTRTIYGALEGISVLAGGVTQVLDLSTAHVGFNTGGTNIPSHDADPQTYSAWRAVEPTQPPLATDHQDFWLVSARSQGHVF